MPSNQHHQPQQQSAMPHLNIQIEKLDSMICKCGNDIFCEGTIIKRVSALLTQNGKDGIAPVPVFYCTKCGEALEELLPEGLKKRGNLIK